MKQAQRGFTLIELAIVLVVLTILAGGLLVPLTKRIESERIRNTQQVMEDAQQALIGYAMSHRAADNRPYLPCPDKMTVTNIVANKPNDGLEDRATGTSPGPCEVQEGNFPWATLGIGNTDAWGNRLRYHVSSSYSNSNNGFYSSPSPSSATLQICNQSACPTGSVITNQIPAVILSFGNNGWGAINSNTPIGSAALLQTAPTSADELENTNGDDNYVSRSTTENFDDLATWLSKEILFSRVCPLGGCP